MANKWRMGIWKYIYMGTWIVRFGHCFIKKIRILLAAKGCMALIKPILLVALVWPACVHSLRNVSRTPGLVAAETLVKPRQDLFSLEELAARLHLSPAHTLTVESRVKLPDGSYKVRIRQIYNNVPLRGFLLAATQIKDVFTGAITGFIPRLTDVPTVPDIPVSMLQQKLISYVNDVNQERGDVEDACVNDLEDFSSVKQIMIDLTTGKPTTIYFMRAVVSATVAVFWPRLIVDASTGEIISQSIEVSLFKDQFDTFDSVEKDDKKDGDKRQALADASYLADRVKSCPRFLGGNRRCSGPVYGPGLNQECLNATVDGRYTVLANERVVVYTLNNLADKKSAKVARFKTTTGPKDAVNEAYAPAADAFRCSNKALDLLSQWGKETLEHPKPLAVYVHLGRNYSNSFYDGNSVVFGDGGDVMLPTAECEVVGHEENGNPGLRAADLMARLCADDAGSIIRHGSRAKMELPVCCDVEMVGHAVLDSKGNLAFRDESRGVAEGFADIFAKSLSAFLNHGIVSNWIFGDCIVREGNPRIRFYDYPSRDGFGIEQLSEYIATNDAYRSLGIITKSFYCLVGTKRVLVANAFKAFVLANSVYWDEATGFVDAACGVYRSANDLQLRTKDFFDCFQSVGIDLSFCHLVGTTG